MTKWTIPDDELVEMPEEIDVSAFEPDTPEKKKRGRPPKKPAYVKKYPDREEGTRGVMKGTTGLMPKEISITQADLRKLVLLNGAVVLGISILQTLLLWALR